MLNSEVKKRITYIFLFFVAVFVLFQLKNFYFREKIVLDSYKSALVVNNDTYNISGKADYINQLFLNNQEFFLDENNHFDLKVYLFNGYNRFRIKGIIDGDKEIIKDIILYYEK